MISQKMYRVLCYQTMKKWIDERISPDISPRNFFLSIRLRRKNGSGNVPEYVEYVILASTQLRDKFRRKYTLQFFITLKADFKHIYINNIRDLYINYCEISGLLRQVKPMKGGINNSSLNPFAGNLWVTSILGTIPSGKV